MSVTEQLSQALSIAGTPIAPQTLNNASLLSGAVNMAKFERLLAIVNIGAITSTGSITAKLQSSATSGGSYTDISGTTLTAMATANKIATIELRAGQLPAGQNFVKLSLTETASQNVLVSGVVLGGEAHQEPAAAQDVAAVAQRLVL